MLNYILPALCLFSMLTCLRGEDDPGKEHVAEIKAIALYGIDDETCRPKGASALSGELLERLSEESNISYQHYFILGEKSEAVFRAYENWINPIPNSKQVMLSYETKQIMSDGIKLSLKLWRGNKQILTADQLFIHYGEPLFMTGPEWRGGKIIIAIELQKK